MQSGYTVIGDLRCCLGEGPLWSARENAIYWVDILAPAVHCYSLSDEHISTWPMPEKIGWLIEREAKPGFIAGFQSGFYELTLDPLNRRLICDPEPHLPDNRMNDAKVDPLGRIWAGTMDCEIRSPTGALYCLDAEHRVTKRDGDYLITNGPAFDAQGGCMYHTDTGQGTIYRFTCSPEGDIEAKNLFVKFPAEWGSPDGMTVDADGGLWIAHWGGGCISRFTADGAQERRIELPASQITSCVFAGRNLDRLFVTSAADGTRDERFAGALFEVDPCGARGVPMRAFAA